jgi:signal transduction histidine kinase
LPAEGKSFAGDTLRVRVLCEMGKLNRIFLGDSSLILLKKALKISQKQHWEEGIAVSYSNMGDFFIFKNEFMKAVDYFYKSLTISIDEELPILTANNYKSLGDCYSLLGNHKKALELIPKSNEIFKSQNHQKEYIKGLNNLGLVYNDMEQYQQAINIFKQGLKLNQAYKYPKLDTYFRVNMGITMVENGDLEEALSNFSVVLKDSTRNSYNDMYVYVYMSEIYEKKKEYQKALIYYQKAKVLMDKIGYSDSIQMLLSKVGTKIFKELNQPEKAFEELTTYNEIKLKNTKQDTEKRIQDLQLEFDNQNQKKEIAAWKRNMMLSAGGISILLILGMLLFRSNKKLTSQNNTIALQNNKIEQANKELEIFNIELEEKVALRTAELLKANDDLLKKNDEIMAALVEGQTLERKRVSVELHDNLGSTISGIKYRLQALDLANFTEKEQKVYTSVMSMMNDAYSEVRLISHNLLPEEFEKKGLKGALEKLVDDINLSDKFKLSLIYREPKQPLEQKVAIELYSICLELVNNIIKHSNGLEGEICFYSNAKNIILNVRDNGNNTQKLTEGFGLKNIKTRVSRLEGELEVLTSPSETEISVRIPVVVLIS